MNDSKDNYDTKYGTKQTTSYDSKHDSKKDNDRLNEDANRDPITGAPGSHPVGTGLGTAGGAALGAAVGAIAGPIGAAAGLVAGGVAGAFAGKGVAEKMDPTVEDTYWRSNYSKQSYVDKNSPYTTYEPAYKTGYEGRNKYPGKRFEDVEPELQSNYDSAKGNSSLSWDKARYATRDAWDRVTRDTSSDRSSK